MADAQQDASGGNANEDGARGLPDPQQDFTLDDLSPGGDQGARTAAPGNDGGGTASVENPAVANEHGISGRDQVGRDSPHSGGTMALWRARTRKKLGIIGTMIMLCLVLPSTIVGGVLAYKKDGDISTGFTALCGLVALTVAYYKFLERLFPEEEED